MDGATITAVVAPILGVIGKALGGGPRLHRSIDNYLKLYERLPENSPSRERVAAHVDQLVEQLIADEATKRRDPTGIGLAITFLIGAAAMATVAIRAESWGWAWWIGVFVCTLFGIVGLSSSAPLAERDEKGNTISKS